MKAILDVDIGPHGHNTSLQVDLHPFHLHTVGHTLLHPPQQGCGRELSLEKERDVLPGP